MFGLVGVLGVMHLESIVHMHIEYWYLSRVSMYNYLHHTFLMVAKPRIGTENPS